MDKKVQTFFEKSVYKFLTLCYNDNVLNKMQ